MSIHPNVILMAHLTPDDLPMKTYRAILAEIGIEETEDCPEIAIGKRDYWIKVMTSDWDEGMQIAGKEGDIVVHALVTYGYGEVIEWKVLADLVSELEDWSRKICEKFSCSQSKICVGANYW